ncbi:MAG: hypothetical protein ACR2G4_06870, partial [Pyrinomonadaceae bacterium]
AAAPLSFTKMEEREHVSAIHAGALVVVALREPREKCWGVLDAVSDAGVYLRAVDLRSFEEILQAAAQCEPLFGVGAFFFPMWRVERVALDTRSGTIPSLAEQFSERTGRRAEEIFYFEEETASIHEVDADAVS